MIPTTRDPVLEESVDVFVRRLPREVQMMLADDRPAVRYVKETARPQARQAPQVFPDMDAVLSAPEHAYAPGQMFGPPVSGVGDCLAEGDGGSNSTKSS